VLQALLGSPDARVLYLFPTKALAQDQLAELEALARSLPELRMFTYDGDTPQDARRAVRARANLVLTNPDMLHSGILPHHTKWLNLFQNLRYVVIDELHAYRGVFGSHLANVVRRLKRICAHYGSAPQFIMASATIANHGSCRAPDREAVEEVAESGAPAGERIFLCYNRPSSTRSSASGPYLGEAAGLVARFLKRRSPRSPSRRVAWPRKSSCRRSRRPSPTRRAMPGSCAGTAADTCPRGGERWTRLRAGDVLGVVSTSALELGVDIGHLDVAVLAGYPGPSRRSGSRRGARAPQRAVGGDPRRHQRPARPVHGRAPGLPLRHAAEHARVNPDNPFILVNHLKCAPLSCVRRGRDVWEHGHWPAPGRLEEEGLLHQAGGRWHWASETYPADQCPCGP